MKRLIFAIIVLVFALFGCYWFIPGESPELPNEIRIERLELTPSEPMTILVADSYPIVLEDTAKISSLFDFIAGGKKTRRQSVNDEPLIRPYIKVDLIGNDEVTTVYLYEDSGKTYLEMPYQGIYRLDTSIVTWLAMPIP